MSAHHIPKVTKSLLCTVEHQASAIAADPAPVEPVAETIVLRALWHLVRESIGSYGASAHGLSADERDTFKRAERWMQILEALYPTPVAPR